MATKKQKREAAETKRKAFEAQLKADGLAAQRRDREERARRTAKLREEMQIFSAELEERLTKAQNIRHMEMAD